MSPVLRELPLTRYEDIAALVVVSQAMRSIALATTTTADLPPEPAQSTADFAARFRRFDLSVPSFHRDWYSAMDSDARRLLLLAPREHAKTSAVLTKVIRTI